MIRNDYCCFRGNESFSVAGYDTGTPDGKFGNCTDTAVRNFHRSNNLGVDGKSGKSTL